MKKFEIEITYSDRVIKTTYLATNPIEAMTEARDEHPDASLIRIYNSDWF